MAKPLHSRRAHYQSFLRECDDECLKTDYDHEARQRATMSKAQEPVTKLLA